MLRTDFLGIEVKSPLVLPAGIMDMSYSGMAIAARNGAGMVTSKSFTLEARTGHKGPVVAECEGGILNCMGLCNPGIKEGLREVEQFRKNCETPVIVSVFATSSQDFITLTEHVNNSPADFLELNLSCPNVYDEFGIPLAASPGQVSSIVRAVKSIAQMPVIAKLSPNTPDILPIARAAEDAGADALCLINTLGPGMLIDIRMVRPVLYNKFGGLSGPCLKPVALRLIYQVCCEVRIPVIGTGGVQCGEDAIEMLMAGASLVGVGTAVYIRGIEVFSAINREIAVFMKERNYRNLAEIPKLKDHLDRMVQDNEE